MKTFNERADQIRWRSSGISLVDLMLSLAFISIVVLALFSLFMSGQKLMYNQKARSMAPEDTRFPARWLTRDINSAVQVEPGPFVFGGTEYTTSDTCLVLKVPCMDADKMILNVESNFDYVIYALDEENPRWMWRMIDAEDGIRCRIEAGRMINDNSHILRFDYLDADGLDIADFGEAEIIDLRLRPVHEGPNTPSKENVSTRIKLGNRPHLQQN